MLDYTTAPHKIIKTTYGDIASFEIGSDENIDITTVDSFGDEWSEYNHEADTSTDISGEQYFSFMPSTLFSDFKMVLDLGCGSGRLSSHIAEKVGFIEAIDPSHAVLIAKKNCVKIDNVRITQASVDNIPFDDEAFDFIFSLGVLHHIPDTGLALKTAVKKLKPGGYFLVYLYYNFENRPVWYKRIHQASELVRSIISKQSSSIKKIICDILAITVYIPFILLTKLTKTILKNDTYKKIPLSYYHDKSYQTIRNDSLDRFGTPLEQRFSRKDIEDMMHSAGLTDVRFSDNMPYWCAYGKKAL